MRRSCRLVAIALLPVLLLLVPASPASSVQRKQQLLSKTQNFKATFGPIPGNFPPVLAHLPTACGHPLGTNRAEQTCDNIPIHIEDPKLGSTEDYLVTITVTWEPDEQVDGEAGVNDLDVYLYDDRQLRAREVPSCNKPTAAFASEPDNPDTEANEADTATCFTQVGQAATATQPEQMKLFSPEPLGDYNLVVLNFSGPNINYTVEATMKLESFDAPFEDLGPAFGSRTKRPTVADDESSGDFAAPIDLSGEDSPTSGDAGSDSFDAGDLGGILAGGPSLDEVPILPDADFTGAATGDGTSQFRAPPDSGAFGATRSIGVAGPVSGVLVVFWMVIVPLTLLGAALLFLLRRSRRSFSFA